MTAGQPEAVSAEQRDEAELPVRQWYPRPKTVVGPNFVPAYPVGQQQVPVARQSYGQTPPAGGGASVSQQVWQSPAPAYSYPGGIPDQYGWQQPQAVQPWVQQQQPAPAWSQYPAQPALPQQGVVTVQPQAVPVYPGQYQYVVPAPAQDPYAYRPWGAATTDENSSRVRNTIQTWQTGAPPPGWGAVPYGSAPPQQAVPQYGGYPGGGAPGNVW